MKRSIYYLSIFTILLFACTSAREGDNADSISSNQKSLSFILDTAIFSASVEGKEARLYTIKNTQGMKVMITNYGGRIVQLWVPDAQGNETNVVIGMDGVKAYENATEPYFGATIGRYGNRIAKGKFSLDGIEYQLAINNPPNTLHGGNKGFQAVVWDAIQKNDSTLELSYLSPDMEENFPGNLTVKVIFELTSDNALKIDYSAETDKNTVINLTNHAFFNLNGAGSGSILNHSLQLYADRYTPIDSVFIPNGTILPVANTPFDFTQEAKIGSRIEENNEQLHNGKGYDHNYVLNKTVGLYGLSHAATAIGDKSGIVLDVYTQEPGLQFYSGNFMQSKNNMLGGYKDDLRTAFCLETQHFPDSPNEPAFPSTLLKAGNQYHTTTYYRFHAKEK